MAQQQLLVLILHLIDCGDMIHRMREIDYFSLKPQVTDLPRAELLFCNRETGIAIDGVVLEKQFSVEEKYLLFLTEGCPYEEGLHIYLLNHEFQIIDGIELSGAYATGILKDLFVEDDTIVTFTFFGTDRWRLELVTIPFRRLNIAMLSPIKYKSGLYSRGWLKLERIV